MDESNAIGNTLIKLDSIESTNNYAEQLCTNSTPNHGTVITTQFQGAGKGQIGRKWHSSAGNNVLMSVIVRPNFLAISHQFYLSMTVALAARDVIQDYIKHKKVYIKWPNDIYVEHKKIAGILMQSALMHKEIKHCIIGIGINVNEIDFPKDIPNPTSLLLETNNNIIVDVVIDQLLRKLNEGYSMLAANKLELLKNAYQDHLYLKDASTYFKVNDSGETFEGKILGVTNEGKLRILIQDREEHFVMNTLRYLHTVSSK